MDARVQDLFIRAHNWVGTFLTPIFKSLAKDLEDRGYKTSSPKPTNKSINLNFSRGHNRFEYILTCMVRPPKTSTDTGHVDLCYLRTTPRGRPHSKPFRIEKAEYDISDVTEKEILDHFTKAFDFWFRQEKS